MTKKERAFLQETINLMSKYREIADENFRFLQDKNREENGSAWCSAETNYKDLLLNHGKDYTSEFARYTEATAMCDLLGKIGSGLADLGFWKEGQ